MPVHFTDYANIPLNTDQYKGITEFLPNILAGYKAAKEPQKMEDERQKLLLGNELTGLQSQKAQLENQYYGQSKESDMALQEAQRRNQLAQALKSNYEAQNMRPEAGENNTNSIPLGLMTAGEKQIAAKESAQNKIKAHSMVKGSEIVSRMRKLIKEHPNMSEDFFASMVDPNKAPGFWKATGQKLNPFKGDLTVAQEFNKEASELVLQMISTFGPQRTTDMRQALVQASKPQGTNTDEANLYLLDNLEKQFKGGKQYLKDLNDAQKNRRYLLSSPDDYAMQENDKESEKVGENKLKPGQSNNILSRFNARQGK